MANRVESLWKRMGEMFGAKALESKFGLVPPDTWRIAIDRLNEYELERGMRRLVYGGKPHIPTLPEFLRMCREVGGDDNASADSKPVPASHQLEQQPLPRWEEQANLHMLGYIWRRVYDRRPVADTELPQLLDAKRYWAQNMRELEQEGNAPADNGKALWAEYIAGAEASIAAMKAA